MRFKGSHNYMVMAMGSFAKWPWGVLHIMGHEVVPRPCKNCDWLLNSSRDHFGSHQGTNVRVTTEFEVPKRHILRPTLFTYMVQHVLHWERQKRCYGEKRQGPMVEKCCHYKFWIYIWKEKMKTREDKRMVKLEFFKTTIFGHILKKWAHSLFGAWSFLLVHIQYTPSENSKGFVNWICLGIGAWKLDQWIGPWKRPSSMVWLHGPRCLRNHHRKMWFQLLYSLQVYRLFHDHPEVIV